MHSASRRNTSLSRCLMAGFACGIVAAALNVLYSYFYRHATDFNGSLLFTPLLIFIGFPILFVLVSVVFYETIDHINKGRLVFTIAFLLLMGLAIVLGSIDTKNKAEGLLLGILIITGLLMALLLPYLATHPKIFMDKEALEESA